MGHVNLYESTLCQKRKICVKMTGYDKPVSTCSELVSTPPTKIRRFKFFPKLSHSLKPLTFITVLTEFVLQFRKTDLISLRFKLPAVMTLHTSFRILSYDSSIDSVPRRERAGASSLFPVSFHFFNVI